MKPCAGRFVFQRRTTVVDEIVRTEIDEIIAIGEEFEAGQQVPMGYGEMPAEVHMELGIIACRRAASEQDVDNLRDVCYMAFWMGRQFGKLESAKPLQVIANAVPMVATDYPSAFYQMAPAFREGR